VQWTNRVLPPGRAPIFRLRQGRACASWSPSPAAFRRRCSSRWRPSRDTVGSTDRTGMAGASRKGGRGCAAGEGARFRGRQHVHPVHPGPSIHVLDRRPNLNTCFRWTFVHSRIRPGQPEQAFSPPRSVITVPPFGEQFAINSCKHSRGPAYGEDITIARQVGLTEPHAPVAL
jgi:hypothetical protein